MADTQDILKAIESMKKDTATKQDMKEMATKQDIQRVEQGQAQANTQVATLTKGQAQTNTSLARINTVLKALEAGQEATKTELKVDIHDLKVDLVQKVKNHEIRIENLGTYKYSQPSQKLILYTFTFFSLAYEVPRSQLPTLQNHLVT